MYEYNADVIRVIDGDTIELNIDLGFRVWTKCHARLLGIDTPEIRTKNEDVKLLGLKAKSRVEEILTEYGNKVRIISHDLDKYGRPLVTVFAGSINVNQLLLNEGLARIYVM